MADILFPLCEEPNYVLLTCSLEYLWVTEKHTVNLIQIACLSSFFLEVLDLKYSVENGTILRKTAKTKD